jgi:hypothetical protein
VVGVRIMAVAVQAEFRDASINQYDQINERIGRLPGAPAARQELFHFVIPTDYGFRVIDVWESEEAFQRYLHETLEPVFEEVGIVTPPVVVIFPVHNYSVGARRP